jgi:hypothetical protein
MSLIHGFTTFTSTAALTVNEDSKSLIITITTIIIITANIIWRSCSGKTFYTAEVCRTSPNTGKNNGKKMPIV